MPGEGEGHVYSLITEYHRVQGSSASGLRWNQHWSAGGKGIISVNGLNLNVMPI
ncbi:hypothetical protein PCANC_01867 [Puccinia coronata f. sp. avenae]|uniref:Uncharacterized protein n=1 Tax=Puccinia coronata f. sp. avenae TaxID=200324 RepID=A0A2N5W4A2_9BASI|nr:hypothetical protein PCANC_01867 [Puccinia coronata f. sp. avenae]